MWGVSNSRRELLGNGWKLLFSGFLLLLFGSVIDITDNFESLNRFIIIGNTEVEAFLEKMLGFLGGFVLIAIGLTKWIPAITDIQKLEKEIAERKEIEKALMQAKVLAEEANHSKSVFLANMSHELRTPLNSIIGFSQLLNSDPFDNLNVKEIKYSHNIMISGEHLLNLINDILDISKIESGEIKLESEKFNSFNFFSEVEDIIRHLADKKNIDICNQARSESIEIYADKLKMKQVMYNLLSNSLKFTPENGSI